MNKIIRFKHPDECDWEDVIHSGLGNIPDSVTEADFGDRDVEPAEIIPLVSRKPL